jgi:hypothetical protein
LPIAPLVGANDVRLGAAEADTVKDPLVAVPPAVVTVIVPVVVVSGTTAVICVLEATVTFTGATSTPLNFTVTAPPKLVPEIATVAPTGPLAAVMLEIVGAAIVKAALVAVPPGVVTVIVPLVAPLGTTTSSSVLERNVNAL